MQPNRQPNRLSTKINGTSSSSSNGNKERKNTNESIRSSSEPTPRVRTSPRYDSPTASSTSRKSPWARSNTSRGLTIDTGKAFSRSLREGSSSTVAARTSIVPKPTPTGSPSSPQTVRRIPGKRSIPETPVAIPNSAPVISPSTPRSADTKVPGTRISTHRVNAVATRQINSHPDPVGTTRSSLQRPKSRPEPRSSGITPRTPPARSLPSGLDPLRPSLCCRCGTACICGTDCDCAEELCQCPAYQLIHSLSRPAPAAPALRGGSAPDPSSMDRSVWHLELSVNGMTCSMCSQAVEAAVRQALPPDDTVASINVSLTTDTVTMEWSGVHPSDTTENEDAILQERYRQIFRNAVEGIGYTVPEVHVRRVSNQMSPEGQRRDLPSGNAVEHPSSAAPTSVEDRWQRYRQRQEEKVASRRRAFLWASTMTLPLLALTMVVPYIAPNLFHNQHVLLPWFHHRTVALESVILWALATPVQFLCGWEFYRMAWYGLATGRAGMDLLVALGTTASYLYACYGVWTGDRHGAHFFETSAVLIAFVLAGKWMQAAAVRRTSDAITQLMELQSPSAIRVQPQNSDGTSSGVWNPLVDPYVEEIVPIHEVKVGDMVKVIRGAAIPVDGIVLHGDIAVDESMMTGESVSVLKSQGSVVLGGTVCVESTLEESADGDIHRVGAAFVQVTGVGSSSALAKIVQLVQEAQTRAVPIQSFADQVSAIFVPTVCVISVVTYMVWYALCSTNVVPSHWYLDELGEDAFTFSLMFAIACLVISCPCALGLATPTAVMVGTGVGARFGVLMKGGSALEVASKVNTIVFDKTGTLTMGVPAVTDFVPLDDRNREDAAWQEYLLWLLGSLERTSEHPLAKAIVKFAEQRLGNSLESNPFVHPTEFRSMTGRGASGTVQDNVHVAIGNRAFASSMRLLVTPQADLCMQNLEAAGKTAILVAVDGAVCLVLGIMDELKPDAGASIAYLRDQMGMDVWMVTGDNSRTAAAISRQVGLPISRVVAEALPADKLEKVRQLQAEGRIVGMVGDGINDSAALAQANVGMAMGTGADIATEASDIILVKGHVSDVCTALHLSRALFRRIQWNLALSLVYNCLGIPIAAGVFYPLVRLRLPPTVAAVAMALSSVSVVLSSLTLRLYRPPNIFERRPPSTTIWDRSMSRRNSHVDDGDEEDSMRQNLLARDHLVSASELTEVIDNRSPNRAERLV